LHGIGVRGSLWESTRLDPHTKPDAVQNVLALAYDDLLDVVPVTRDLLKIKEPGRELLKPAVG